MALAGFDLATGRIHGDWIKEVTHRTGYWGLIIITATLAITPLRRLTGFNRLQSYRRMLGLFGFFYISVHFLVIYIILDKQVPFDPGPAWHEIVMDIAKRPYITVGFVGWLLMIPLVFTSTKKSIKRLGKDWVRLHALIYVTAMAGVIHFMWSVKADRARPITIGIILMVLLALRLVPLRFFQRLRGYAPVEPRPLDGNADVAALAD
ncbi:MAG TPA: protein-methionine-sulfoxide reductase heme-binding subunit MsrQ [Gemmatimonadales bacterium]|jgi:sulfoxide reductase heme-binding subunit YedZ